MLRPERDQRKCASNALEKGGKGSITEQLLNARPDVTLGGGAKTFAESATAGEWQGKTLHDQAVARGYQIVTDASSLAAISRQSGQTAARSLRGRQYAGALGRPKGVLSRQYR